ncbi:hypothetical protein Q0590_33305 [Rhodocytophaga aerolata]|uniref:DUF4595 domain-containing protein n=1 Tax=Rhodocytophaga aerolata TaxID=455078 RepID=A0ABT8RGH1_9BACT|nr:hypothetical protein [Rhodocytophaga aerolata]MDO1451199.1 hypothetical protein [Rhodocytophaga aerolata]
MSSKTNSLFIALYLLSLTFLTSCEKDDQGARIAQTTPACRLTKIYNPDKPTDYTIYKYDNEGKLTQAISYYEGQEDMVMNYEYNPQDQLTKHIVKNNRYWDNGRQTTKGEVTTLEYNQKGQIAKYVQLNSIPYNEISYQSKIETTCEYDLEGNRTKNLQVTSNSTTYHTSTFTSIFTYQDGNCIKAQFGQGAPSEFITEYEYYLDMENKQRSFSQSYYYSSLSSMTPSKNMMKKMTASFTQYPTSNYTIENSYQYNTEGFATTQTIVQKTQNGSATLTTIAEYECR